MQNEFLSQKLLSTMVPGNIVDGRHVVATAGTAVQFPDVKCTYAILTAEDNNTGPVVFGASTVVAAVDTIRGTRLAAGDRSEKIYVDNLNKLFLDSRTSGDGVSFTVFV